jgi:hypothetical protein
MASRTTRSDKGSPETATVRQDQVALQFEQPIVGNPLLREQAEARVDAINGAPGATMRAMLAAASSSARQADGGGGRRAPSQIVRARRG